MKSFEQLVAAFVEGVQKTQDVDYENRASVRRNNRGVEQYRLAIKEIDLLYLERIDELAELLNDSRPKIRLCCAVCLVELTRCSEEIYQRAVSVVEKYALTADAVDKRGFYIWLDEHKKPSP